MSPVRSAALLVFAALVLAPSVAALTGCNRAFGPYTPQSESARDSLKAQKLTQQAAKETDPEKAEQLLREALTADLYHGPAHNNLGVVLLNKGDLYSAASEFEWARKLMPGHPDPRLNLALTMEKAGRIDEALTAYTSALEVYDGHIPTMQAITRLRLKSGRADQSTRTMLEEIALKGENERWREWARKQLTQVTP